MAPPEGYQIELHGALSEPITIAGVPRSAAILIGTLTAILALGCQAPWLGVPLGLALHVTALWLARRDPQIFEVLGRHLRHRAYLDA